VSQFIILCPIKGVHGTINVTVSFQRFVFQIPLANANTELQWWSLHLSLRTTQISSP